MEKSISKPAQPHAEGEQTRPASRWALVSLSLCILLSSLGTSIANVGLPTLAQAFNASFQQVQWVVLAYLLAITVLVVSVGRLGDLIGRRRLLLAGILIFTVACILCSLAPTLWLLIAARAVQGLGAAIMMALAMAMVAESVRKESTGSAMGLLGTMSAIGTALGPTLGGVLIAVSGWPALFLINVPLGMGALFLVSRYLPDGSQPTHAEQTRFDALGALLLSLTLGTYALAMTMGRGNFSMLNAALLSVAAIGLGLFVQTEVRAESPLIRMAIFKNPTLSAGFVMSALVTTVVMATLVVGPFYLAGGLNLNSVQVGLVMSSGPIVAALTGTPAGRLVDRFGAHRMGISGLLTMAAGALTLPISSPAFGVPGYIVPLVFITAGYSTFQAANNTAVMKNIEPNQRGVISGMLNLSRNLGLITGASLMGTVFATGAATTQILTAPRDAVVAGMRMTFAVAAGLIVMALAITLAAQRKRKNERMTTVR